MLAYGPYMGLFLAFYEQLKGKDIGILGALNVRKVRFAIKEEEMSLMQSIGIGGISSGAAAYLTNGLDMSKLRMQIQRTGSGGFEYRNIFHGISLMIQKEGVLSLFRGNS